MTFKAELGHSPVQLILLLTMKKPILFFLFICIFSCTEETEFKKGKIDFSGLHNQTPVLLSLFTSDSVLNIRVGSTQQAFDDVDEPGIPVIKNASIENLGTGIAEVLYPHSENENQYVSDISLTEGVAYRINLEFPGISEKQVWASDTIPFKSKIKSISIKPEAKKIDNELLPLVQLEILPSPFQKVSSYEITVITSITDTLDYLGLPLSSMRAPSSRYLYSDDRLITTEDYYPSILQFDAFPPENLYFKKWHNNNPFLIEFYYSPPNASSQDFSSGKTIHQYFSHTATIVLKTISQNFYKYHTSRLKQFYSRVGDPLYGVDAPVSVFSNIENGEGIFAAYTTDSIKINFKGSLKIN